MDKPWSRRVVLVAGSVAPFGGIQVASAHQDGPEAVNEAAVRRFYAEVYSSRGDLNVLDEVMIEDYPAQNSKDVSGRGAYKQRRVDQQEILDLQYSEWQFALNEVVAVGERVFVRGMVKAIKVATTIEIDIGSFLSWIEMQDRMITKIWYEFGVINE